MRHTKFALAAMALAVLAGCGGTSPSAGDQTLKTKFASEVVFGDSLSDVGTYNVGTVTALKGGTFTINGDNTATNPALTGKNWTVLMAAQLGLPVPCAAQTGLQGDPLSGFSVAVTNHPGCLNYAQGGARVTEIAGPGHLDPSAPISKQLGALTVPVKTQIANHLAAVGGKFKGDEVVFVMAGANDIFVQLQTLSAQATAAGTSAFAASLVSQLAAGAPNPATAAQAIGLAMATESANPAHTDTSVVTAAVTAAVMQGNTAVASPTVYGPMVAKAQADGAAAGAAYGTAHGPDLVANMAAVAGQLVTLIKGQIVANGATHVVVNNLPDVANTPFAKAQAASTQALVAAMVSTFNNTLASGLAGDDKILVVDVYTTNHDQATNPGPYGLTNVTDLACDMNPAKNPLNSSLACNGGNLIAGDVSHYEFADTVHPTPFAHLLLARYVAEKMVLKGWL